MRSLLMVVVAAAFLAAGTSAVRAQGEFPLKYVLAEENDPLTSSGISYSGGMTIRPSPNKPLPEGLSDKVRYFRILVGGKPVWAALDAVSPPKLYVDVAGTGDFSSVAPLVGKASGSQCTYGPIDVPLGDEKKAITAKVLFVSIGNNQILGGRAAGYMGGAAILDGQTYRVAVLDKNLDGRYERAFGKDGTSQPLWRADAIAIDSNQDGKLRGDIGSGEIMPLSKAVCVKGKYYLVEVAPDGSSIKFEKYEPKTGTLDIGTAASLTIMTLMSDTGMHSLSGSSGKWQVPEGRYACQNLQITKTDADGKTWTLIGSDVGSLAKFEVRGGETTAIQIGPPLALKVDAQSQGGQTTLNLVLVGKAGETYSIAPRKGTEQPLPPKVKVFDASGKVLAEGNSEFG
ncbi:MAG: hypothetical protein NTY65_09480 [Planctomycetota bacterium]|nr:hypothetical protein [Planctomycetota bacterium]